MAELITTPNIPDSDGFYAELLAAHEGLGDDESTALNARLIHLLANHVGDRAVLRDAIRIAAKSGCGLNGFARRGVLAQRAASVGGPCRPKCSTENPAALP